MSKKTITFEKIKEVLSATRSFGARSVELRKLLKLSSLQSKELRDYLNQLVSDGKLIKIKHNRYALPDPNQLATGRLTMTEKGFGFVISPDGSFADIFISNSNIQFAMHGDTVLVQILKHTTRFETRKAEGIIVDIVKRNNETLVGTLEKLRNMYYVVPENPKITQHIYIATQDILEASAGQKVLIKIESWPTAHTDAQGKVLEILGWVDDPKTDFYSVIANYHLSLKFPKSVTDEADQISHIIPEKEIQTRLDLRNTEIITIDPTTAKDFDDAISISKISDTLYEVGVHIADVTQYLKIDSAIDREARQRANSTYLLDKVIPMLPEVLSNDLCSLKPNEDRLTVSAILTIDKDKGVIKSSFHRSIICSKRRFNYDEVDAILNGSLSDPRKLLLEEMVKVSQWLRDKRMNEGGLNFNMPERVIQLDEDSNVKAIVHAEYTVSHQMIEDFMLAANRAVAEFLSHRKAIVFSRLHEEPDAESYLEFVHQARLFGYQIPLEMSRKNIQTFFNNLKSDDALADMVQYLFLRSMKQAQYSAVQKGHFALAFSNYVHFTSPIRRYADVIIHRTLLNILNNQNPAYSNVDAVQKIAEHCSLTERNSMEAERELADLKIIRYLEKIFIKDPNKIFEGIIYDVRSFGFFVRIKELRIDGLIRVADVDDDFYIFDPDQCRFIGRRTKHEFKLGDAVSVTIKQLDLARKRIDFYYQAPLHK